MCLKEILVVGKLRDFLSFWEISTGYSTSFDVVILYSFCGFIIPQGQRTQTLFGPVIWIVSDNATVAYIHKEGEVHSRPLDHEAMLL